MRGKLYSPTIKVRQQIQVHCSLWVSSTESCWQGIPDDYLRVLHFQCKTPTYDFSDLSNIGEFALNTLDNVANSAEILWAAVELRVFWGIAFLALYKQTGSDLETTTSWLMNSWVKYLKVDSVVAQSSN